jgi:ABC-type lipoprotein export system ATPase subunit
MVTHDQGVAAAADRVLVMADGRIVGDRANGPAVPGDETSS